MKQFLAVRSVPLAYDTMASWRDQGVVFRRRGQREVWDVRFHEPHIEAVLNLGNLDMNFDLVPVPIFNDPKLIRHISAPLALRRTLNRFLPKDTIETAHWHKRNGMKGVGKVFHDETMINCDVVQGDVQQHIEGTEYRVITVGGSVVQATKKTGTVPNFHFDWVGVQGIAKTGIIPMLHEAVKEVPTAELSVIGWDIIVADKPYIIEANTSPGVNNATAERIVNAMKELI